MALNMSIAVFASDKFCCYEKARLLFFVFFFFFIEKIQPTFLVFFFWLTKIQPTYIYVCVLPESLPLVFMYLGGIKPAKRWLEVQATYSLSFFYFFILYHTFIGIDNLLFIVK